MNTRDRLIAAVERLTPEEHGILERGALTMSGYQNVAHGTSGYVVRDLCRRGLMRRAGTDHTVPGGHYHYEVTRAGRDAYVSYGPPSVPITAP